MNNSKIDIDVNAPLDEHGEQVFEKYKTEITDRTIDDVALLLTHMHLATEKLITIVNTQERSLTIATAIKKVYKN